MHVLIVLTSHDTLGNTGKKTGFWLEEFASPYYVFKDAGVELTLASLAGGQPPLDPKTDDKDNQTTSTLRFKADKDAQAALANTSPLKEMKASDFDAVFYPGGHGPLWDLTSSDISIDLIESFLFQDKPVATVCHAPSVLLNVQDIKGEPIVKNKSVTGFSNSEEEAVGLTNIVPFLLEDELTAAGAFYHKGDDWSAFCCEDGLLITGQNPQSSEITAKALLTRLKLQS